MIHVDPQTIAHLLVGGFLWLLMPLGFVVLLLSSQLSWQRLGGVVLGAMLMLAPFAVSLDPVPPVPPVPTPPGPTPPSPFPPTPPVPVPGTFAQAVAAQFVGQSADAAIVASLFDGYALSVQFDGTRAVPLIATTSTLGSNWAAYQEQFFGTKPTPMATKYPQFETLVATELKSRGIVTPQQQPLDTMKRAAFVGLFREVAAALGTVK